MTTAVLPRTRPARPGIQRPYSCRSTVSGTVSQDRFWTWFLLPGEPAVLPTHAPLPVREVRGCRGPRSPAYCVTCATRLSSGAPRVRIREQQAVTWMCLGCSDESKDPRVRQAAYEVLH